MTSANPLYITLDFLVDHERTQLRSLPFPFYSTLGTRINVRPGQSYSFWTVFVICWLHFTIANINPIPHGRWWWSPPPALKSLPFLLGRDWVTGNLMTIPFGSFDKSGLIFFHMSLLKIFSKWNLKICVHHFFEIFNFFQAIFMNWLSQIFWWSGLLSLHGCEATIPAF